VERTQDELRKILRFFENSARGDPD